MSDGAKLLVGALAVWFVVGQCSNPNVSAGKTTATGVAVGAGIGVGLAGTAAVGAAARGAAKGLEDRARDRVRNRPNGPARPYVPVPPSTVPPMVVTP